MATTFGEIRLATFADYEAVLDIDRNVYSGLDYVPTLYFNFLHSGNVLLVTEQDGLLVSSIVLIQFRPFLLFLWKLKNYRYL